MVKNAKAMAKTFIERGYKIVSGGTDNHLMLVDLIGRDVTGKDAEAALGKAHITVNKNAVPNDPRKPVRHLRPARRHAGDHDARLSRKPTCVELTNWICDVLDAPNDEAVIARVRDQVTAQCHKFPVYG